MWIKILIGTILVIVIQLLSRSKHFYIAGMAPLFPTFMLIANYVVGTERTIVELKSTIVFGMLSLIPYLSYLIALYLLVDRLRLVPALLGATACWFVVAILLITIWNKV
jgi:uncharacterized membrane protein (GlpM family)